MLLAHDTATSVMDPVMQFGFAGLSCVLLVFLFWGVKRLLAAFEANTKVIEQNAATIDRVSVSVDKHEQAATHRSKEVENAMYDMREKLITRPCIARGERGAEN